MPPPQSKQGKQTKLARRVVHQLGTDEEPTIVITDPRVLKAFFDPLRYRIMKLLDPPKSVRELAAELGIPSGRLYYHVDLLVTQGLAKVADQRVVGTNVERVFARAAGRFELTEELADLPVALRTSLDQLEDSFASHLRRVRDISGGRKKRSPTADRSASVADVRVRVAPDKADAFAAKVRDLISELKAAEEDDGERYALLFVFSTDDAEPGDDA